MIEAYSQYVSFYISQYSIYSVFIFLDGLSFAAMPIIVDYCYLPVPYFHLLCCTY